MAQHQRKRIRSQLVSEDNTDNNDCPDVDSNDEPEDEESLSSSAAPMGDDTTDEQRLGTTLLEFVKPPMACRTLPVKTIHCHVALVKGNLDSAPNMNRQLIKIHGVCGSKATFASIESKNQVCLHTNFMQTS
ncbi:hypothetical protein MJO28_015349 [Puccinia striiformis f. sp. tritici]|uniref:Uncharacterized protein n=1 Tax=Puccinia striiformis f. sp. tritici TaxID=168172 RepID=A0ACC0DTU1_9BASI|nr:hypothetical protein MJO28_015349 [Puccinia striiformis f. sp. tritici]